jgi:CelD/BcsL family acetyltransferase involved in cellulose biosynthesis
MYNILYYENLSDAEDVWRKFEKEVNCLPFQTYDWLNIWQSKIGIRESITPVIVVITDNFGTIEAIYPFGLKKVGFLKILVWLGGRLSDYCTAIISTEKFSKYSANCVTIARKVSYKYKCNAVMLNKIPAEIFGRVNPILNTKFYKELFQSHHLTLSDSVEVLIKDRFSSKARYNFRRSEKILRDEYGYHFKIADDNDSRKHMTNEMIRFKSDRYQQTGVTDIFKKSYYHEFYHAINKVMSNNVHVSSLTTNTETIAVHWGLESNNILFYLMPAFNIKEYSRFSPGSLLTIELIKFCQNSKIKTLDFTIGDEEYKKLWCSNDSNMYFFRHGYTACGIIYVWFFDVIHWLKKSPLFFLAKDIRSLLRKMKKTVDMGRK